MWGPQSYSFAVPCWMGANAESAADGRQISDVDPFNCWIWLRFRSKPRPGRSQGYVKHRVF